MNATPVLPCPTPYKHAYRSRGLALAGFVVGQGTTALPARPPLRPGRMLVGSIAANFPGAGRI